MAEIKSICYQTAASEMVEPYHYNRTSIDYVELIAGHGIEGDRKAGRNPKRQLNIMSAAMVATLQAEGYQTAPGELGEQLVISGLDAMTLERGSRLQFGDSAIIEITMPRTPCSWFELIQGKTMAETAGRIGVMATVIASGSIAIGDPVIQLETVPGEPTIMS